MNKILLEMRNHDCRSYGRIFAKFHYESPTKDYSLNVFESAFEEYQDPRHGFIMVHRINKPPNTKTNFYFRNEHPTNGFHIMVY